MIKKKQIFLFLGTILIVFLLLLIWILIILIVFKNEFKEYKNAIEEEINYI